MSNETNSTRPADQGLEALVTLLHLQGVAADAGQIAHRLGTDKKSGAPEMLRCAKDLGLKARASRTDWSRLGSTPLPAIAALRDGGFLVIAKATEDKVLVQLPASRPALMTRDELTLIWDGQLILMTRRAGLSDITRRFDIAWFLGAIHKYRHLLGEVLVASFFLQLFGLVFLPLFFQVVIDKVLVHRSLTTLDVLVLGLVTLSVFETVLGVLRTYLFSHTTNRIDVELGARLFHCICWLCRWPISRRGRVGDFGGAGART